MRLLSSGPRVRGQRCMDPPGWPSSYIPSRPPQGIKYNWTAFVIYSLAQSFVNILQLHARSGRFSKMDTNGSTEDHVDGRREGSAPSTSLPSCNRKKIVFTGKKESETKGFLSFFSKGIPDGIGRGPAQSQVRPSGPSPRNMLPPRTVVGAS